MASLKSSTSEATQYLYAERVPRHSALLDACRKNRFPHGIKPGSKRQKVLRKMRSAELYLTEGSTVTYTFDFDEKGFEFGDLTFYFEQNRVSAARVETYFVQESKKKESGMAYFKRAYNDLYGPYQKEGGLYIWTHEKAEHKLEIILEDISNAKDEGYLILFAYTPLS